MSSTLAAAGTGAWLGGTVGMNVGNTRLKRFEEAIAKGELLVMVDVPRGRVEEIEGRIKTHLPAVEVEATEPAIPAFP